MLTASTTSKPVITQGSPSARAGDEAGFSKLVPELSPVSSDVSARAAQTAADDTDAAPALSTGNPGASHALPALDDVLTQLAIMVDQESVETLGTDDQVTQDAAITIIPTDVLAQPLIAASPKKPALTPEAGAGPVDATALSGLTTLALPPMGTNGFDTGSNVPATPSTSSGRAPVAQVAELVDLKTAATVVPVSASHSQSPLDPAPAALAPAPGASDPVPGSALHAVPMETLSTGRTAVSPFGGADAAVTANPAVTADSPALLAQVVESADPALMSGLDASGAIAETSPTSQPASLASEMRSATTVKLPPVLPQINIPADPGAGFDDALGARMSVMLEQGIGHARIRVSPEHLGAIDLQLSVEGDRVTAQFNSAHADVRAALESGMARLREQLASQGLQLAQTEVGGNTAESSQKDQRTPDRAQAVANGSAGDVPEPVMVDATSHRIGLVSEYA